MHVLKNGYHLLNLCRSDKGKITRETTHLHIAVLKTFVPKPAGDYVEVHHKDFDKGNNRLENLMWLTRQENIEQSHQAGRLGRPKGS